MQPLWKSAAVCVLLLSSAAFVADAAAPRRTPPKNQPALASLKLSIRDGDWRPSPYCGCLPFNIFRTFHPLERNTPVQKRALVAPPATLKASESWVVSATVDREQRKVEWHLHQEWKRFRGWKCAVGTAFYPPPSPTHHNPAGSFEFGRPTDVTFFLCPGDGVKLVRKEFQDGKLGRTAIFTIKKPFTVITNHKKERFSKKKPAIQIVLEEPPEAQRRKLGDSSPMLDGSDPLPQDTPDGSYRGSPRSQQPQSLPPAYLSGHPSGHQSGHRKSPPVRPPPPSAEYLRSRQQSGYHSLPVAGYEAPPPSYSAVSGQGKPAGSHSSSGGLYGNDAWGDYDSSKHMQSGAYPSMGYGGGQQQQYYAPQQYYQQQ